MVKRMTKGLFSLLCIMLPWGVLPAAQLAVSPNAEVKQSALDFRAVAKKDIPSVVSIKVQGYQQRGSSDFSFGPQGFSDDFWQKFFGLPENPPEEPSEQAIVGQASGFIVSQDGYILTNNHVVKEASTILVTLTNGQEYPAKLVGGDVNTDVAVVKIDAKNLPALKLGDSDKLEVGQWVAAIGNPFGLQASLTVGVVSATGRSNLDITRIEDFIQTDAAINRGNSGGPLVDLDGNVVGMNTAIASNTGGYMGIGFAIPSNLVKRIMEQLLATGSVTRGFLGVVLQKVDSDIAAALGLEKAEGALVADVSKESPAAKAGLKQGDVILKYDGHPIDNIGSFRNAVALTAPGTKINLTIKRGMEILQVSLIVGSYPESQVAASEKSNQWGITLQNLTPELAQSLGYKGEEGVLIAKVDPKSVAAMAGIKKGSLILAINQQKVFSVEEANALLDKAGTSKPLLLLVKQGQTIRFVSLKIEQ